MPKYIYVVSRVPVSANYIPLLDAGLPIIRHLEVMKETAKGYRLRTNYEKDRGSMYLFERFVFYTSYAEALAYVEQKAKAAGAQLVERQNHIARLLAEIELKRKVTDYPQEALSGAHLL